MIDLPSLASEHFFEQKPEIPPYGYILVSVQEMKNPFDNFPHCADISADVLPLAFVAMIPAVIENGDFRASSKEDWANSIPYEWRWKHLNLNEKIHIHNFLLKNVGKWFYLKKDVLEILNNSANR